MAEAVRISDWEQRLRSGLPGWEIVCVEEVGSTMDLAREHSKEPALVLTRAQFAGRGRQGSTWVQPQSGFYATYRFAVNVPLWQMGGFSLVVGVALAETLDHLGVGGVSLKWPNDLLTQDGRKLAGILIELGQHFDRNVLLAGVGVNLAGAPPGVGAASLQDLGLLECTPVQFAEAFSPRLAQAWERFHASGFKGFKFEWMRRAAFRGEMLSVNTGREVVTGRFVSVSDSGALLLERGGTEVEVVSGHVERPR